MDPSLKPIAEKVHAEQRLSADEGLALLDRMHDDIAAVEHRLMHHLTADDHRHLIGLLERIRADQLA